MVLITIVTGVYKPTYNCGAAHCNHLQGATQGFRREEFHLLKASPRNIKHWIDYHGNQKDME